MGRTSRWSCEESSCGSEACTDGCGDQIACRVWVHRGREYTEPPVAMIVDAILGHVYRVMDAERIETNGDAVDGVLCQISYMLMPTPLARSTPSVATRTPT
jgi:Domain of unknown function (DUF2703)